jgi:hypothetical protein
MMLFKRKYPITGWGQVFNQFWVADSLPLVANLLEADSVVVDDRARGGRSTRAFFQEGNWLNFPRFGSQAGLMPFMF